MRFETSNIKSLPDTNRMGHTCTNLNGELFFIWGGADDSLASTSRANSQLWIYETLTGYWRRRECTGECPPYLSGATSCLIGGKMYTFGGHSVAQDNWLNNLYCLDLDSFVWTDLSSRSKADPSKPIRCDKSSSWSFNGRVYIFGGYGWAQTEHLLQLLDKQKDLQLTPDNRWPKFGWNNQLVEFNPRDNTWRWPSYSGKCPSARAAHSGDIMQNKYYLFGGRNSQERLNDLYVFDMDSFEWTQIAVVEMPVGASFTSFLQSSNQVSQIGDNQALEMDGQVNNHEADTYSDIEEDQSIIEIDLDDDRENPFVDDLDNLPRLTSDKTSLINNNSRVEDGNEMHSDDSNLSAPEVAHNSSCTVHRWSIDSHDRSNQTISSEDCNCSNNQILEITQSAAQDESNQPIEHMTNQQPEIRNANHDNYMIELEDEQIDVEGGIQIVELDEPDVENQSQTPVLPEGRSFSSFTPISATDIMLYGGISSQDIVLDDCWIFNVVQNRWTQVELKHKLPRLWHSAARTRNNELVIIGGSCSIKVDEFCSDVLAISLEPKSLKRLALDTVARSIRIKTMKLCKGLPSTIEKLIRLRKQAIALTMRRTQQRPSLTS